MEYVDFFLENDDPTTAFILCAKNNDYKRASEIENKYSLDYNLVAPYFSDYKEILHKLSSKTFLLADCARKRDWKKFGEISSLNLSCDFNIVMEAVGESGDVEKIKECIEGIFKNYVKGTDSKENKRDILGRKRYEESAWNRILLGAARKRQQNVCELAIKNGANNLFLAAIEAGRYDNLVLSSDIFPQMPIDGNLRIHNRAYMYNFGIDSKYSLVGAIERGYTDIIELFEESHPKYFSDWVVVKAMVETCNIPLLIKHSHRYDLESLVGAAQGFVKKGYTGIFTYVYKKVRPRDEDLQYIHYHVSKNEAEYGYIYFPLRLLDTFAYFLGCMAGGNYKQYDDVLSGYKVYESRSYDVLKAAIESNVLSSVMYEFKGPYTKEEIEDLIDTAIGYNNLPIVKFLYNQFGKEYYKFIVDMAASYDSVVIFEYFSGKYPEQFSQIDYKDIMKWSIVNENINQLTTIVEKFHIDPRIPFDIAIKFDKGKMVQYIYDRLDVEPTQKNVDDAVSRRSAWEALSNIGKYDIVKYRYEQYYPHMNDHEIIRKMEEDKENRRYTSRGPEYYVKNGILHGIIRDDENPSHNRDGNNPFSGNRGGNFRGNRGGRGRGSRGNRGGNIRGNFRGSYRGRGRGATIQEES